MNGGDGTTLVGAGLGVLLVLAYAFREWINRRESPSAGWQAALKEVRERADGLDAKLKALEARIATLTTEGAAKDAVIAQQQRALDAKDGRIVQLVTSWPPGSKPPHPSPAHEPYL